ncbi:exo-alpha-sialidase [Brachyspira aalborgi]|nr:exo-alpha-sialidase [Brachyspira aalborgi]
MTWEDLHFTPENGYSYPFFINCHNGDILLGVTTATKSADSKTIFYRSANDGETWTKQDSSSVGLKTVCNNATDGYATYGQGITLRHGGNLGSQKLMFPYFYNAPDKKKTGYYVGIMYSDNNGDSFKPVCEGFTNSYNNRFVNNNIGSFGVSFISKIIELANGDILLNMRRTTDGDMFWMLSKDCGKNWNITVDGNATENGGAGGKRGVGAKNADFIRYEFNGKDIKPTGSQYALMITSYESKAGYDVMLTVNDFNHGQPDGGTAKKYKYTKNIISASTGGYPAITVLPDGTIATLTEDSGDMYFRRFNLYWLTRGNESINYSTDTSVKF